jgi:hypothetical protein
LQHVVVDVPELDDVVLAEQSGSVGLIGCTTDPADHGEISKVVHQASRAHDVNG